ncbi:MAG: Fe-S-containing protein, partial [Syntrophales bacterium]
MITYLSNTISVFLPPALLAGLFTALWLPVCGRKALRLVAVSLTVGLAAGTVVYLGALSREIMPAARTSLYAVAVMAALCQAATFLPVGRNFRSLYQRLGWGAALFFLATLAAVAVFSFLTFLSERGITAIGLLNTELILNSGAIIVSFFLLATLIPITAHLGIANGRGVLLGSILSVSGMLVLQGSAEVLLGLMRLEAVELTSIRLSFVAKVAKYSYLFTYMQIIIMGVSALFSFARRQIFTEGELAGMEKEQRRKAHSRIIIELRWFKGALAVAGIVLATLLYYDLAVSRPPRISPAANLAADASRLVRIKIDDVKDGILHRYSFVTDDGHVVRFFLINRSHGEAARIGVVYDACMLCGDMGYIQEKNEVICLACNVRIFIPSIGKAG